MLGILKGALATITKHWKAFAGILLATLIAVALALLLHRFSAARLPAALTATSAFLILLLWLFPKWQVRLIPSLEAKDRFDRENEARKTLSQIVGGLALLIGFYFTWQNLVATQESQITDRFTKAIGQLGETKLEIRLGGIYALERIAKDSPKDHWPIMEVLTAYVREHARGVAPKEAAQGKRQPRAEAAQEQLPTTAPDIQAIVTVLGRRTRTYGKGEEQSLDLHGTDLTGAYLHGANLLDADLTSAFLTYADLTEADLSDANLTLADLSGARAWSAILRHAYLRFAQLAHASFENADLRDADAVSANLSEADFFQAILTSADFFDANLTSAFLEQAHLDHADLKFANLTGANLEQADLSGADLSRADFSGADLRWAKGLTSDQLDSAKGNAKTQLPDGIPRPKSWQ